MLVPRKVTIHPIVRGMRIIAIRSREPKDMRFGIDDHATPLLVHRAGCRQAV
jgi:hypothetical protein